MSTRGGGKGGLLKDLRKQVAILEDDLRARTESVEEYRVRLTEEHQQALDAGRTAAPYEAWRDERVTQAAVAWVLACVFVRFCESNGLIEHHWIAGAGDGLREAEERHEEFFRANPEMNDRDWLIESFERLAGTNPAVAGLFDKAHNPLWEIMPSYETASELLKFWRRMDEEGTLVHDFVSPDLNTRFLGDLYQDLSEAARKTYALLQTPEFVEEFILDLTLEPAIDEFGLAPVVSLHQADGTTRELPPGLRTIDPACGSGHFLLGLFERLLGKWRAADTEADDWTLIRRAMESVHGCDKNPFAVAIARFRLLVAALKAAKVKRLATMRNFPINVAVADSLLHGRGAPKRDDEDLFSSQYTFYYRTEDIDDFSPICDLLTRDSYHVVVGNPPYITVKDEREKANYRVYESCSRQYALSVPFAERFFQLALRTAGHSQSAGHVGQITSNSFMKREFGKPLIEGFFNSKIHLTHVIDTSGAYIPGHGTPTVILVGRNHFPRQHEPVRAVLGIRGEPTQPADAANGLVWNAVASKTKTPGEDQWVSSTDAKREQFSRHPWSLSGGGASDLMARLSSTRHKKLMSDVESIGFCAVTREDDAYMIGSPLARRRHFPAADMRPLLAGVDIRDWALTSGMHSIFPYTHDGRAAEVSSKTEKFLWPNRLLLKLRRALSGTQEEQGLAWFEYSSFSPNRFSSKFLIPFSFVATHGSFSLRRNDQAFLRSAPVIKLLKEKSEDEHLALLGVLNSSTACFWLKQVSQDKGNRGGERSTGRYAWENYYEFTGTKLQDFPLPSDLPFQSGRALDSLAQQLANHEPSALCATGDSADRSGTSAPSRDRLDTARTAWTETREQMIAFQEELDWEVYHRYGLLGDAEKDLLTVPSPTDPAALHHRLVPQVRLGERAFEILMARKIATRDIDTAAEAAWFARHRSTPTTEIPDRWPAWYRDIVQARIDVIEKRKDIALIERPECKRRWATDPWDKKEKAALRTWLLDRCEDRTLWFHTRNGLEQPRTLTVGQLADALSRQPDADDIAQVAALYATHLGKPHLSLEQVLLDATDAEHVPYLAAYRYRDSGLRKRAQWEKVWDLQREEDRTGEQLKIPIPPKYTSADFAKQSYWSNRGKLDVPKERFVSYPDGGPDNDPTLLLGWAGWDQRDQALALLDVVQERRRRFDWQADRLIPLLAGLAELMPWLKQWFGEVDEEWGDESAAEEIQGFLDGEMARLEIGAADLAGWRPAKGRRGRKPAGKAPAPPAAKAAQQTLGTDDDDGDEG